MDAVAEVIQTAEQYSPQERINHDVDVALRHAIQVDISQRILSLNQLKESTRGVQWCKDMAYQQSRLTKSLFLIGESYPLGSEHFNSWSESLSEDLSPVLTEATGPISTLTLIDMTQEARPNLAGVLKPSRILTTPDMDVIGKVDAQFKFGDTNPYVDNAEIVRFVQIKAGKGDKMGIWSIDRQNINGDYLDYVSRQDVKDMMRTADKMESSSRSAIDVQMFVAVMPAYRSKSVNNIFGRVDTNREVTIRNFERMAYQCGFLPPVEKGGNTQ